MKEFYVQHYTFKPLSDEIGFDPVLKKLSELGYSGVETCFFGGFNSLNMTAKELKSHFDNAGLKMTGNMFSPKMFDGDYQKAFDYIAEAGGQFALFSTSVWRDFKNKEDVALAAEFMNQTAEYAEKAGISLVYHNHAPELATLDGKLFIDHLLEQINPKILLETDVFYVREQGLNEIEYISKNCERIRLIHLKQINNAGENVDLEDGIINMKSVVENAKYSTHFILEQSSFKSSINESLEKNAKFLKNL